METLQGTLLKGYQLEERIGSGGFGAVYRARQTTIGREVAIKIILPGYANDPDFIRRFESEAYLVARLEHPYITPLHDFWRDPEGAYLVMRYLRGGSIRSSLQEGAYELNSVSQVLDQISAALDFAHRNDVIHRDIKPGNILLDEDGNAYLADFGIAKDLTRARDNQTGADAVVGSLDYISPEQARSEPVTPRTDIYSLGVTLYEMITGEHPFKDASSVERLYKHINDPLPEIAGLPDDVRDAVNEIIRQATAKNPDHRYPDVLALAIAFREGIGTGSTGIVEQMTMREQEVLSLIAKGMNNREIAETLVVTMGTVKWHITQLYKKLGVRTRVQAIVRARELNLIVNGDTSDSLSGVTLSPTVISLPEPENPYKGLHAFQMTDSRDFFGRDDLTKKLVDRMSDDDPHCRFLAIVGPSGSGKSSLVKAGLIPALWKGAIPGSEKWFVVDMIPGTHPLDKLETALIRVAAHQSDNLREQLQRDERGLLRVADIILPGDHTELVIVVDQFEEVFTLVEDEESRQHFLDLLHVAVSDVRSRVRVVVTLRADYYDRPLHYPEFGELFRARMETVLPLSAKGLERAVRGPAERVGVTFEQGLVEQIVSAMNYQAGALPLLQYALTELFDRRSGRILTNQAYQEIGGAVGALANRADEIFNSLTDEAQALTHQMFLRLVTLGEGAEDTRRRAFQDELFSLTDDADLMEEIIDTFAAYRLLSLDHDPETRRPTVEVAHEAILREWEQLRIWLNDSRDDIRQERLLAGAAEQWSAHQQDMSYLLHGSRLGQMERWQETTELILTPLERDYIAQSIQNRSQEQQAEAKRAAKEQALERRSRNALRGLVVVMTAAAVIAIGLALFAFAQQSEAEHSAAEFRSVALASAADNALDSGQPDMALALAREAVNMENPPLDAQQLFYTAASSTWIKQRFLVSDTRAYDAVYHPDSKRIITSSYDGRAIVWDIETGEALQSIQRAGRAATVGIHPDGNIIAIGGDQGLLQIWNLETDEVHELVAGEGWHQAHVFTRDGTRMVTTDAGTILVWDMETLTIIASWEAHVTNFLPGIDLSPDDTLLISGANDGFVRIWDFESGELLQSFDFSTLNDTPWVWDAQFLPDNEHVLIGGGSEIVLWNWQPDEVIWVISVENTLVQDIALSPDQRTFIVGLDGQPPVAELRSTETGSLIRTYEGHSLRIQNVDYSPDGTTLLTGSNDGTAIVWPVNWEGAIVATSVNVSTAIVAHPTRPLVAVIGEAGVPVEANNIIRLVDTNTGEVVMELEGHRQGVKSLTFSPDGRYLFSGDIAPGFPAEDQLVYVWDIEAGEIVFTLHGHYGWIVDIAMSHDGRLAAIGEAEGARIILWDTETSEPVRALEGHADWVNAVVFSPDDQYLYSGGRDGSLYQWDVQTGEIIARFGGHPISITDLGLNTDGTQLISASEDQTSTVWDTSTHEALYTLGGHTEGVFDSQFSPDSTLIMTTSDDGRIILWDAKTQERLRIYVVAEPPTFLNATFSADGKQIISGANNQVTVWDASPLDVSLETWVTQNRYIPDFTCEQRELYVIEPLCESEP